MTVRSLGRAAATGVGAALIGLAALRTRRGAALDARLFEGGNADAGPVTDRAFLGVTELGSLYAACAAACTIAALGRRSEASRALAAAGMTWLLGQGVKKLVDRPRPYEADAEATRFLVAPPHGTSWPSSHPAVFTTFAVVAARELGAGAPVHGVVTALGVVVAASRVYVGVHYPSDVVSGLLMGRAVAELWSYPRR